MASINGPAELYQPDIKDPESVTQSEIENAQKQIAFYYLTTLQVDTILVNWMLLLPQNGRPPRYKVNGQ